MATDKGFGAKKIPGFLTVGEFAKLTRVSRQTLRYYDGIGILKPSYRDPETGYRYYEISQIYLFNIITVFVDYGIPLADIKSFAADGDLVQLRRIFAASYANARQHAIEAYDALVRMESYYDNLESLIKADSFLSDDRLCKPKQILAVPLASDGEPFHFKDYRKLITECVQRANENGLSYLADQGLYWYHGGWLAFIVLDPDDAPSKLRQIRDDILAYCPEPSDEPCGKTERATTFNLLELPGGMFNVENITRSSLEMSLSDAVARHEDGDGVFYIEELWSYAAATGYFAFSVFRAIPDAS